MKNLNGYVVVELDESSKAAVAELAIHSHVYSHHCTLAFKPEIADLPKWEEGSAVEMKVLGMAFDGKGQALLVDLPVDCANANPHVTVSCTEGIRPVYSNELLGKEDPKPCSIEVLRGVIKVINF